MSLQTNYTRNLIVKTERLKLGLAEISHEHLYSALIPTPITKGYRSRAKYKVFGNPKSFSIKGTDPICGEVPYEDSLWVMPSWGRKLVVQVVEIISDKLTHFWVDGFEVQLAHGNKHAHITLSVKRQDRKSYAELAEFMLDKISSLEGVSIPSKKQDMGKSYLLHTIDKKKFYAQYAAFFQSNASLTTKLVKEVTYQCEKLDFYRILDLYCGVGLFSLSIAENTTPVLGVDINKRAIDSARLNARKMDLGQVSFICSPVENFLQSASIGTNDLVIIDPPRSGCPESLIHIVSERKPDFICSISCALPSHIRNLKQWMRNSYDVQSITALDMFPFTEYLETVVFLQRKN
ncbi:MAG: class I SAM-dependent RNA methyltransferase [Candidatus Aminicenantes bacterium]|nr:MAG: class I SAM-dependent RNA methyltransferase [Candidatus Aminicenantes bacterium]